jgi:hypothetical protein
MISRNKNRILIYLMAGLRSISTLRKNFISVLKEDSINGFLE